MRISPYTEHSDELNEKLLRRFEQLYGVNLGTDCWEWTGTLSGVASEDRKYSSFMYSYGHVWSYYLFVDLPTKGLSIDHLCNNPICVNPQHLEEKTQAENVRRGKGHYYKDGIRYCKRHHAQIPVNLATVTQVRNGTKYSWQICAVCKKGAKKHRA